MIRSWPAPIPSGRTPSTSTANSSGVEPRTTVNPWPCIPAATEVIGTAVGQSLPTAAGAASGAACAGAVSDPPSRASSTPVPVAIVLRLFDQPTSAMEILLSGRRRGEGT